ncbi:MAG: hypothetical protein JXA46_12510 [Dehalococcoidales bacterium]|nr:hypothetical protein [Dehalococcoidales bacterium]
MAVAGIDIGSRTTKLVVLADDLTYESRIIETGIDFIAQYKQLAAGYKMDRIIATGYGRHLARANFASDVVTEIKAFSIGARHLFPDCRTIIDVGGQDSKVIAIDQDGGFTDFVMNDRCAAGTGKFLEVISRTIGFELEEFGDKALCAERAVSINSMCTVFAESEVISLISRGENPLNIALGLHESIVNRLVSMGNRIGVKGPVVFAGGVAKNRCVCRLLEKRLEVPVIVPENPQIIGALGAALEAARRHR